MLLLTQILLITILCAILIGLYKNERAIRKKLKNVATLEKFWDGGERRHHVRFTTTVEVIYKEAHKRDRANSGARSLDFSNSGLRLLMDKKMLSGTLLDIDLIAQKGHEPIHMKGAVVWCNAAKDKKVLSEKQLFHVGVRIVAIKHASRAAFTAYIASLERMTKNPPPAHTSL